MARPKKSESETLVSEETSISFNESQEAKKELPEVSTSSCKSGGKTISPLLKKFIDEETKMVRGRFRIYETPGASQKITVGKYPGVKIFEEVMTDGQMYTIPLYVARFLNGVDKTAKACGEKIHTCSYPVHGFLANDGLAPSQGGDVGIPVPIIGVQKRNRRYGFESLEFDTE